MAKDRVKVRARPVHWLGVGWLGIADAMNVALFFAAYQRTTVAIRARVCQAISRQDPRVVELEFKAFRGRDQGQTRRHTASSCGNRAAERPDRRQRLLPEGSGLRRERRLFQRQLVRIHGRSPRSVLYRRKTPGRDFLGGAPLPWSRPCGQGQGGFLFAQARRLWPAPLGRSGGRLSRVQGARRCQARR